jgi:hypothetical protein
MVPAEPYQRAEGNNTFPAYTGLVRVSDTDLVRQLLEHPVARSSWPADVRFLFGVETGQIENDKYASVYAVRNQANGRLGGLSNKNIVRANGEIDVEGGFCIMFYFDAYGSRQWEMITTRNLYKPVAICLNGKVVSAPIVNQPITGGICRITFGKSVTFEYCRIMGILLSSNELPLPVRVSLVQTSATGGTLPPVPKYVLLFLLSFSVALGIQLLIFRLNKV